MRIVVIAALNLIFWAGMAAAFTFPSIDGGEIDLDDWKGQPVLVVNTASLCGFTYQYDGLQALYDGYRDAGLVVLAVPSADFRQELATGEQVKKFCAVNFNLDFPMTMINKVRGSEAHPFYKWVKQETGFTPNWNFNKILLDAEGNVARTFGSSIKPESRVMKAAIEGLLPKG